MEIGLSHYRITDVKECSVKLASGDSVTIQYIDPTGRVDSFIISARHLTTVVEHEQSCAAIVVSTSKITCLKPVDGQEK